MISKGRGEEYGKMQLVFNNLEGKKKIEDRKQFAFSVYRQYPLATAIRMIYHAFWNLFEPHWEYILNIYGTGFKLNSMYDRDGRLKKEIFLGFPFYLYGIVIYSAFSCSLLSSFSKKKVIFLLGLFFYTLPFAASFINGQGARMRLCVEPIITIIAIGSILNYKKTLQIISSIDIRES